MVETTPFPSYSGPNASMSCHYQYSMSFRLVERAVQQRATDGETMDEPPSGSFESLEEAVQMMDVHPFDCLYS